MTTEQVIDLFVKIVVPIVTAVIGLLSGMHIEKRKYVSKIKNNR